MEVIEGEKKSAEEKLEKFVLLFVGSRLGPRQERRFCLWPNLEDMGQQFSGLLGCSGSGVPLESHQEENSVSPCQAMVLLSFLCDHGGF